MLDFASVADSLLVIMQGLFDGLPHGMSSYVPMSGLNRPIDVAGGEFEIEDAKGNKGIFQGRLYFKWMPSTGMEFEGEYSGSALESDSEGIVQGILRNREMELNAPAFLTRYSPWNTEPTIRGILKGSAIITSAPKLDRLRFCLVNFPKYLGNPIKDCTGLGQRAFLGRMEFSSPDYHCIVDTLPEIFDFAPRANLDEGFLITHVGELKPVRGRFESEEAESLVDMLHQFFGFLAGKRSGPVFPQGFTDKEKTWEQLAAWRLAEWRKVQSWLPESNRLTLDGLFSGFVEKWSAQDWQSPLRTILGWYFEANSPTAANETRAILGQVALEMLAWVEIVERQSLHSHKDFERMSAAGRIRSLLHHLRIPTDLPTHFPELQDVRDRDAFDGPGVITTVRNALVHATEKKRIRIKSITSPRLWQVGQLALQYLELTLLALCGYQGKYARRGWRGWKGEDETIVPWAPVT